MYKLSGELFLFICSVGVKFLGEDRNENCKGQGEHCVDVCQGRCAALKERLKGATLESGTGYLL